MIIIIHGDDVVSTRKEIDTYTNNKSWVKKIDASKNGLSLVTSALESQELFNDIKIVVVENLFSASSKEKIIDFINRYSTLQDVQIVIWESKKIDNRTISKVIKPKTILKELPKYYYEFLDSLKPKNSVNLKKTLIKLLPKVSEEQIFYSIVKRVRTLLIIKNGANGDLEETKNMSPWQLKKLETQARLWNNDELLKFYNLLFKFEIDLKTSQLAMPLEKCLDFLLFSL